MKFWIDRSGKHTPTHCVVLPVLRMESSHLSATLAPAVSLWAGPDVAFDLGIGGGLSTHTGWVIAACGIGWNKRDPLRPYPAITRYGGENGTALSCCGLFVQAGFGRHLDETED